MKNKFLILGLFSILSVSILFQVDFSGQSTSKLVLKNIEALADNGEYEYPDGFPYSSTCNTSIGKHRRCKVEIIICQGGGSGCNSKGCPSHKS